MPSHEGQRRSVVIVMQRVGRLENQLGMLANLIALSGSAAMFSSMCTFDKPTSKNMRGDVITSPPRITRASYSIASNGFIRSQPVLW